MGEEGEGDKGQRAGALQRRDVWMNPALFSFVSPATPLFPRFCPPPSRGHGQSMDRQTGWRTYRQEWRDDGRAGRGASEAEDDDESETGSRSSSEVATVAPPGPKREQEKHYITTLFYWSLSLPLHQNHFWGGGLGAAGALQIIRKNIHLNLNLFLKSYIHAVSLNVHTFTAEFYFLLLFFFFRFAALHGVNRVQSWLYYSNWIQWWTSNGCFFQVEDDRQHQELVLLPHHDWSRYVLQIVFCIWVLKKNAK